VSDNFFKIFSGLVSLISGLFILVNDWSIPRAVLMFMGFSLILAGVLLVSAIRYNAFYLILLGFYTFARTLGYLNFPYLRYGLGIPMVILGIYLIFTVLAGHKTTTK